LSPADAGAAAGHIKTSEDLLFLGLEGLVEV